MAVRRNKAGDLPGLSSAVRNVFRPVNKEDSRLACALLAGAIQQEIAIPQPLFQFLVDGLAAIDEGSKAGIAFGPGRGRPPKVIAPISERLSAEKFVEIKSVASDRLSFQRDGRLYEINAAEAVSRIHIDGHRQARMVAGLTLSCLRSGGRLPNSFARYLVKALRLASLGMPLDAAFGLVRPRNEQNPLRDVRIAELVEWHRSAGMTLTKSAKLVAIELSTVGVAGSSKRKSAVDGVVSVAGEVTTENVIRIYRRIFGSGPVGRPSTRKNKAI